MATQISLSSHSRLADITSRISGLSAREQQHHIRADPSGDGKRVYTSSKLSLTSLKAFLGFRGSLDARMVKRDAGLNTLKTIIDREYGEGAADRALAAMGLRGAREIRANQLLTLQETLNNQRDVQVGREPAAERAPGPQQAPVEDHRAQPVLARDDLNRPPADGPVHQGNPSRDTKVESLEGSQQVPSDAKPVDDDKPAVFEPDPPVQSEDDRVEQIDQAGNPKHEIEEDSEFVRPNSFNAIAGEKDTYEIEDIEDFENIDHEDRSVGELAHGDSDAELLQQIEEMEKPMHQDPDAVALGQGVIKSQPSADNENVPRQSVGFDESRRGEQLEPASVVKGDAVVLGSGSVKDAEGAEGPEPGGASVSMSPAIPAHSGLSALLAVLRSVADAISGLLTEEPLNAEQLAGLAKLSGKGAEEIAALQDIFIADPEKKALPKLREECVKLIENAYERMIPKDDAETKDGKQEIAELSKNFSHDFEKYRQEETDLKIIENDILKNVKIKSTQQEKIGQIQNQIQRQQANLEDREKNRAHAARDLERAQGMKAQAESQLAVLDDRISELGELVSLAYINAQRDQEKLQELDDRLKTDDKSIRQIINEQKNIESIEDLKILSNGLKEELNEVLGSLDGFVQGDDLESEEGKARLSDLHSVIFKDVDIQPLYNDAASPDDYIDNMSKLKNNFENLVEEMQAELKKIEADFESGDLDENGELQRVPDDVRDYFQQIIDRAGTAVSLIGQQVVIQSGMIEINAAKERIGDALDEARYSADVTRLQRQDAVVDTGTSAQAYRLETNEAKALAELELARNQLQEKITLEFEPNIRKLGTALGQMDAEIARSKREMEDGQKVIDEASQDIVKIDKELEGLAQKKSRVEGELRGLDQNLDRAVGEMILKMRNRIETLANP